MSPLQLYALRNPKLTAHTLEQEHFTRIGPWLVAVSVNA